MKSNCFPDVHRRRGGHRHGRVRPFPGAPVLHRARHRRLRHQDQEEAVQIGGPHLRRKLRPHHGGHPLLRVHGQDPEGLETQV